MELTEKHRGVAKRKLVLCSLTHLPVIENMHLCGSSDLSDSQIPGLWKWVITFYFFHFKLIWPRLLQFASLQIWTPKAVFLLLLVTFNKNNEIIAFSRGALTQRNVRRSKPAQNQTCKNSRNCYWARCACPLHTEDDVSYIMGFIKRFKPQGAVLCVMSSMLNLHRVAVPACHTGGCIATAGGALTITHCQHIRTTRRCPPPPVPHRVFWF